MDPHPDGYLVKLVRDAVPEILGASGTIIYRPLPPDEHSRRLRQKLVEEATEYAISPSLTELAQVYVVLLSLCHVTHEISPGDLFDLAAAEIRQRGRFHEGVGMYAHHPRFDGPLPPQA